VTGVIGQLREGIGYIRDNPTIAWSLAYLGISASLIGVVAVLGPSFARDTLGLNPKDLIVVVLPLGLGIVMGVLLLNNYGKYIARRRAIELGLVLLGILLLILTVAGPVSRILTGVGDRLPLVDLSSLTSLVSVVVALAFLAGVCYGIVAISAQVQLQEDIPPDGRGRVFGVLNMLISVASILPIIIVGPISDLIGTTAVILVIAGFVLVSGLFSIFTRGPILSTEGPDLVPDIIAGSQLDPTGSNSCSWSTRSSLTCVSSGSSPTSSRKMVPPCASSKRPTRRSMAPVKAPFTWPNSSLSTRPAEMAAQFTLTSGRCRRGLRSWIARAISSLPVPVSPRIRTVELVCATLSTSENTLESAGLSPTISRKLCSRWISSSR